MNTQVEQAKKETTEKMQDSSVKELTRQYQEGALSTMEVLMAIRELLVKYN